MYSSEHRVVRGTWDAWQFFSCIYFLSFLHSPHLLDWTQTRLVVDMNPAATGDRAVRAQHYSALQQAPSLYQPQYSGGPPCDAPLQGVESPKSHSTVTVARAAAQPRQPPCCGLTWTLHARSISHLDAPYHGVPTEVPTLQCLRTYVPPYLRKGGRLRHPQAASSRLSCLSRHLASPTPCPSATAWHHPLFSHPTLLCCNALFSSN